MSPVTLILFCSIYIASTDGACNIIASGVSSIDQKNIVDKHNSLRKMLTDGKVLHQPPATNMKIMVYDLPLEQAAQNIANTCDSEPLPANDSQWGYLGQNLFTSMSFVSSSDADWNVAIQSWFNEHVNYIYPAGFSGNTGHYTQVAWANSTHVGCGYTLFTVLGPIIYRKKIFCYYRPGGNVNNLPPYEIE